jgi:hypothetical protein
MCVNQHDVVIALVAWQPASLDLLDVVIQKVRNAVESGRIQQKHISGFFSDYPVVCVVPILAWIRHEVVCRTADENGICRFEQPLEGGWLNGICDYSRKTVYIDIFNEKFFDPRTAAEKALQSFNSTYYRMQPHVRQ